MLPFKNLKDLWCTAERKWTRPLSASKGGRNKHFTVVWSELQTNQICRDAHDGVRVRITPTSLRMPLFIWKGYLRWMHAGVGNCSKRGKCGSAPTWRTSGEWGWRAGPTSMDRFSSGKSGLHCTLTGMRLALAKTPSPRGSKCLLNIFIFPKSELDLPGMEHSWFDHFSFYIANILLWCIQRHPLLCLQKITTQNKPMRTIFDVRGLEKQ